jgi:hypothetical protein
VVIERTHAWGNQYGNLRWCTDRRGVVVEFWPALAAAAIVWPAGPPRMDLLPLGWPTRRRPWPPTGAGPKQADRLEARQRELLDHRVDDGVTFEQLGVDYLLVDECFPHDTPVLTDRGVLTSAKS